MGTLGYDDLQRVISFLNSPVGEQGKTHLILMFSVTQNRLGASF